MDRMNKAAQIGIGFTGLGFLVIFIAWYGAAGKDCPECQIPYLISGGATGIGLIIVGAALLLFEASRRDRAHLDARLEDLRLTLEHARVSTNGSSAPVPAAGATAPVPSVNDPNLVVLGRSSYHRTDCRLVEGKDNLVYGDRSEATEQGLQPCRVCEPVATGSRKR